MENLISQQFIDELGTQRLLPAMHNGAPLVQASGWTSEKYFSQFYKDTSEFPVFVSTHEGKGVMYIPLNKGKILAEEVFARYLEDKNILKKIETLSIDFRFEIDALYKKMSSEYFLHAQQEEIKADLLKLRDATWNYNALAFFSTGFDHDVYKKVLECKGMTLPDSLWAKGSQAPVLSFSRRHGLHIRESLQSGRSLQTLGEECQYFFASYDNVPEDALVPELLKKDYGEYVEGGGAVENDRKKFDAEFSAYTSWFSGLSQQEKDVAEFLSFVVSIRDERKDYLMKMVTVAFRSAGALLKKTNLSKDLAKHLLYNELLESEAYIISHGDEIKDRYNGFDVFCSYRGESLSQCHFSQENRKRLDARYTAENVVELASVEIRGASGSKGCVRGKVKIIQNILTESSHFNEGDILVTGMTRPEFVPLMKRASAIVTDEGGITCHAAIVSRELGIPCIIGTKIATQVLKDGDMVEVDADKGIITMLK